MKHFKLGLAQVKTTRITLLFVLILVGGLLLPFRSFGQGKDLPVLSVEKIKYGTAVSIQGGSVPGLIMDLWCYEDNLGNPASFEKDGNAVILIHKRGTVTVTSRFVPVSDGVDIYVTVTGPNADDVKKVRGVNPCCILERSPSFKNKGDYVDDFVGRCFVFLQSGMTSLKDTKRIPGTMPNKDDEQANLPKPWIQEYYPAWRKHPGQVKGERGYSTDRPVYPIIGAISSDGKYLAAVAWPETGRMGQVWHDCVHPRPDFAESFDAATGQIKSHAKVYLMKNNGKKLIASFKKDFPQWKRPPDKE